MSATLLARVRRVVLGNDGRALIHAVEESGLEHKIEVLAELVRDASASDGRRVLLLAWSIHELPELDGSNEALTPASPRSEAPTTTHLTANTAAPSDVDAAFMALIGHRTALTASPSTATRGPETPLAALLGLVPGDAPR